MDDTKFKIGDRVIMLINDGWGCVGWVGTINDIAEPVVYINWDNGRNLCHKKIDLAHLSKKNNPNILFLMHKKRR